MPSPKTPRSAEQQDEQPPSPSVRESVRVSVWLGAPAPARRLQLMLEALPPSHSPAPSARVDPASVAINLRAALPTQQTGARAQYVAGAGVNPSTSAKEKFPS